MFFNCADLRSLNIPASVTESGELVCDCKSLAIYGPAGPAAARDAQAHQRKHD